nr:MAG TPA: hypothetical protein [Caudoviricetes sp.]
MLHFSDFHPIFLLGLEESVLNASSVRRQVGFATLGGFLF